MPENNPPTTAEARSAKFLAEWQAATVKVTEARAKWLPVFFNEVEGDEPALYAALEAAHEANGEAWALYMMSLPRTCTITDPLGTVHMPFNVIVL